MSKLKTNRLGEININNQKCPMKIIKYNNRNDIIIEFQDQYQAKIHATYNDFLNGRIKNPYHASVFGVGITGTKYPAQTNGKLTKEYVAWRNILNRCFNKKEKERHPYYQNVTCCDEWLLYENFYEWIHKQLNFDKWLQNDKWAVDKDILIKGNNIYSPNTCCLVPSNINSLFCKSNTIRGDLPIGVTWRKNPRENKKYMATISKFNHQKYIGNYSTPEEAFQAYKKCKENQIKEVAQEEYNNGNITKECYEAMMKYEVEITD